MTRRIVGLTGSLGVGKSTVSGMLTELGIPVFDADRAAHQVLAPGSAVVEQLHQRYGDGIVDSLGRVNRAQLATMIFGDPQEKQWVEDQIHPLVRHAAQDFLERWTTATVVVLDVPLLIEAQMTDLVSEIWVVTCPAAQQWERVHRRHPQWTEAEFQQRLAQQLPQDEKVHWATHVVDNSGSLAALRAQVMLALNSPPDAPKDEPDSL
ncbi:MAG: dephospho-CoA kinase [Synechococcales cyanobacterium]